MTLVSVIVLGLLVLMPARALAVSRAGASLTAGYYQTCAVEHGTGYCWGPGSSGQLGDGSTSSSGIPVPVDTSGVLAGKSLAQISAGDGYTCALDTSGAGYCWGTNADGELGDGGAVPFSDVPVRVDASGVLAGKTLVQIAAGQQQACVLDTAGQVYCWGANHYGQLGDGSTVSSSVPVAVDTSGVLGGKVITHIAGGSDYTCAVDTSGAAYCWGADDFGQLGDGSGQDSAVPAAVDASGVLAGKKLVSIAANESEPSTCALDSGGSAYCWGINFSGQLGNGTTGDSLVPVAVDTSGVLAGRSLTAISTGGDEACALDTAGAAYCWGGDFYGQLGNDSTGDSSVPVAVDTTGALAGKTLTQISAGGFFWACAIDTSGAGYCWGYNSGGQLGGGNPVSQSQVPVQAGPSPPTGVRAVPGNGTASVSWTAPALPGILTGYTAFASPGGETCAAKSTACTIRGLTDATTYSITVVAHTASADSAASAPVSVTPCGRVAFTSSPHATAAFGVRFSFTVRASGTPAPKITRKGRLPSGVKFTAQANGTATLTGTPRYPAAGIYRLAFVARSRAGTATQAFTLTVTRAPVLRKIPDKKVTVGTALNLPLKATGYPVPRLTESGRLPRGVSFTDNGNGTGAITGTPVTGSDGCYRITIVAASTSGTARRSFILKVRERHGHTGVRPAAG